MLCATVDAFEPAQTVPCASDHYDRSRYALAQNDSLLDAADLAQRSASDPRFLVLPVGGSARLMTLLDASQLAPENLLGYVLHARGRQFLLNRREEIVATVLGRRFRAGAVRL